MLRYRLYFVGLYLCALLYIAAGINHFVNAEMYLRTMHLTCPLTKRSLP